MSYRSLAEFIDDLIRAGELVRISAEVDPQLELAEITRRLQMQDGPAVMFAAVRGCEFPVVANLFGTERRAALALGAPSLEEATARLEAAWKEPARSWFDQLRQFAGLSQESGTGGRADHQPRLIKQGPCQQVVRLAGDVNLQALPVLQLWPDEPVGRINAAALLTADSLGNARAAAKREGQHPTASGHAGEPLAAAKTQATSGTALVPTVFARHDGTVIARNRLAVHCRPDDHLAEQLRQAEMRGEALAAALVLGGDPGTMLAASAPLPPRASPTLFASFLRGRPLELVECRTIALAVPADAEWVIEGRFLPGEQAPLGRLCTAGGTYAESRAMPVMEVTAVTHRINPVFPCLIVGPPPNELSVMNDVLLRLTLPLVQRQVPEVVDLSWTDFGRGPLLVVALRKSFPYQARKTAAALWGYLPLMRTRLMVLVDAEADVREPAEVMGRIAAHCDVAHDVFSYCGPGGDTRPAGTPGATTSLAIDATAKLPEECPAGYPAPATMTAAVKALVDERWENYGLGGSA